MTASKSVRPKKQTLEGRKMRTMVIQFPGDNWDSEEEAERLESEVQDALDVAEIDYLDVHVQ